MIPLATAKADLAVTADRPEDRSTDRLDALVALHNRTVDALAGYTKMVEKAEPSFRPTVESFRALHANHADQLARTIGALGGAVDADGTLMGTVNVAVVSLRAMFDTIDADVLDSIRNGEASVLDAFDDAIAAGGNGATLTHLTRMRDALTTLLDRFGQSDRLAAI